MNASADTIREMAEEIKITIGNLEHCGEAILSANSSTEGWNDGRAAEFNIIMAKVSRLMMSPVDTLKASLPKLEALAQSVDDYNNQSMTGG